MKRQKWQSVMVSTMMTGSKLGGDGETTIAVNNDDEERVTTTADMSYNYDINELSSLGFDVTFGVAEGSGGSDDTTRADFSASYNYKLTEDWNLKTGVAYKVRDEENDGTSDSTSIFLSLNREFTFYP